jgi:hypothetical protein
MKDNDEHDCHDDSVGSGTGGTANFWLKDKGETQNRPDLCKKAEVTGSSVTATARVTGPGTATRVGSSPAN